MRIIIQRVSRAEVRIDGRVSGSIARGFVLLVGFNSEDAVDSDAKLEWMAEKVTSLRLFPDENQKMNLGLEDVGGGILVVSQFTLYGDASKGRRPSFIQAARPDIAIPLYERFVELLKIKGLQVETGEFGAMMEVDLINDGPVTLILER
jgi:D-tyrosyl-tRNA(Tyr) deacylase